jgi:hypothetical protein
MVSAGPCLSTDARLTHFVVASYPSLLEGNGESLVVPTLAFTMSADGVSSNADFQSAMPPFQPLSPISTPVSFQQPGLGASVRCVHYDRTGVCYLGELCGFDHRPRLEENAFERQSDATEDRDQAMRVAQLLASRNEEIETLRRKIAEMSRAKGVEAIRRDKDGLKRDLLAALHDEAQDYYKRHSSRATVTGTGNGGGSRGDFGRGSRAASCGWITGQSG